MLVDLRVISYDNTFPFADLNVKFSLCYLLWIDEFEPLLRLSNNGLILISSGLNKSLLEWFLPNIFVFLIFFQRHFSLRLLLKALQHERLETCIGILNPLGSRIFRCCRCTSSQSRQNQTHRVHNSSPRPFSIYLHIKSKGVHIISILL